MKTSSRPASVNERPWPCGNWSFPEQKVGQALACRAVQLHGQALRPTNDNENALVTPPSLEPSRECKRAVPNADMPRFSGERYLAL